MVKKKILSGLLAVALAFGTAAALPKGVFDTSLTVTAETSSTLQHVAAKSATCTADGNIEYWIKGGKYYSNKDLTKQISRSSTVVKATGHKFSAWTTTGYDFNNNTSTQVRKCSVCGNTEKQTTKKAISRLSGADSYETAAQISKAMYPNGTDTAIIVTRNGFNDALAAVPLAHAYNAPLLYSNDMNVTMAELARLKVKKVIIVSTDGAVGSDVKAALSKYNPTVISGKDHSETAVNVAKALQAKRNTAPDTIFFTNKNDYADSLSVSPVAAIKNAPIIYLDKTGSIDTASANYLKSVKGKVKNAYIIGSTEVISSYMMTNASAALGLTGSKAIQRIAGCNSYDTCIAINSMFKSVLSSSGICVAPSVDYAEAVVGAVGAAKYKRPLLLADTKSLSGQNNLTSAQKSYLKDKNASKITVFGGKRAVSNERIKEIAKASV